MHQINVSKIPKVEEGLETFLSGFGSAAYVLPVRSGAKPWDKFCLAGAAGWQRKHEQLTGK